MRILITGATGLVGSKLLEALMLKGYEDVVVLTRNKKSAHHTIPFPVDLYEWNPEKDYIEAGALKGVDVIIHLAGENISAARWEAPQKAKILNSRVKTTELLLKEIKKLETVPKKFISSSAVGIYGSSTSDKVLSSESALGDDFLAEVCKSWEKTLFTQDIPGMKAHCIRTGIVLTTEGGALAKMLPPFLMGVAGKLGSGKQYMSWIHIDDLVAQFLFLIQNEGKHKTYNGVAPEAVTNTQFTKVLGEVVHRPTLFPVPAIALKAAFGEMSDILLKGQRVAPKEFLGEGFIYMYPTIEKALSNLLEHINKGEVVFKKYFWIDEKVQKVFSFFADEKNLEKITPPHLNFKILKKSTENICQGTLIDYQLRIHGVPVKWRTEITSFEKDRGFTDHQLSGPYAKWVHQHDFIPYKNGTLMKDEVVYKVPMGILGKMCAGTFVKKDIAHIFRYRNKMIHEEF